MSIAHNKFVAAGYYEVIDKYGPAYGSGFSAPNSKYYGANHSGFDADVPGGLGAIFYAAFPDYYHVILEQIGEGDIVMERIRYFATHSGPFMGIPATGRKVTYTGMDWVRFENGKSVERWGVADSYYLRQQLLGLAEPDAVRPPGV